MTVRRMALIWFGSVAALAVLVFGYSRRAYWLDSIVDPSLGDGVWSFRWDLFLGLAVGFTLLIVLLMMFPILWILNQKRARKLLADDSAFIVGVRNYHRSLVRGGPLAKVRRMGHFSNVLVARERASSGIVVMGGVFRLRSRWETSWAAVEEIEQFTLTPTTHHVAGVGVSMRLRGFAVPLEFALVSSRFPWADVAGESEVTEAIKRLRALRSLSAGQSG